ncbi:hypothetical protein Tco_0667727 [Tanacetum coccineum]
MFLARKKFNVLAQHLQEVMEESFPKMVDSSVRNYMSGHIFYIHLTQGSQASAQEQQYQLYLTMKDNPQLQHDDLPSWLALKIKFEGLHASNTPYDDELLAEKVSQELMDEMSQIVDEAKLCKVINEMLSNDALLEMIVQSCQRDPKAPALSLVNQDLLYLKKGNPGSEKFMLSLHKFPAVIFLDDDIEERTSRWVDKCVKMFNPYARYNVEH